MAEIYPYRYVGGTWYTTGMPKSRNSSIFTGYAGWAMAPIFKNPNNYDIKITAIKGLFGVSAGSASAVAICGSLYGDGNPTYVWPGNVSNACNVPVQSALTTWTSPALTSNPVVPANGFFYAGFKFARNNNTYSYLNVARTNCASKSRFRPFYNAQSLGNVGNPGAGAGLNLIDYGDTWAYQVPIIVVEYVQNAIKPSVSTSSITLVQGSTGYVNIGGYDGWRADVSDANAISTYKNWNQLQVYAKYRNISYSTTSTVTVHGLNDSNSVSVTVNVPTISTPSISPNIIRPTESASISCYTSDSHAINYSLNDYTGVSLSGNTIKCNAVTTDTSWPDNKTITVNAVHTENNTVKSSNTFKLQHWPQSEIKFSTAGSTLYSDIGSYVNFVDATSDSLGKCDIKVNIVHDSGIIYNDTLIGKYLSIEKDALGAGVVKVISDDFTDFIGNYTNAKLQFVLSINYDKVVKKTINTNIEVIKTVEFDCIYPLNNGNKDSISYVSNNTLPLFANSVKSEKYEINYSNYPIVITYPNKGNSDITIHNKFSYTINSGSAQYDYIFKSRTEDYKVVLSHFCNSSLLKPGSELWIALNLENRFIKCKPGDLINITYTLDVPNLSGIGTTARTITIKYKVYYDSSNENILPFMTGQLDGNNIQGSQFSIKHIDVINTLASPITQVLQAYGQITNTVSKIISAKSNEYISNTTDKSNIESLLSKLSILIQCINDSSNRYIDDIRSEIALGQYIMWNDSEDTLANGQPNMFKLSDDYRIKTASPWYELFRGLKFIQFGKEVNVVYNQGNVDYQVSYKDNGTDYDLSARR